MRSSLRSPAKVEGTEGFLPPHEKDVQSPSSKRLEARFPYHDSRAMTCTPRHSHRDPTSLVPHERLTSLASYLVRNPTLGPPLEKNPETPASSFDDSLRFSHGLEPNPDSSLQTPQEEWLHLGHSVGSHKYP